MIAAKMRPCIDRSIALDLFVPLPFFVSCQLVRLAIQPVTVARLPTSAAAMSGRQFCVRFLTPGGSFQSTNPIFVARCVFPSASRTTVKWAYWTMKSQVSRSSVE